MYRKIDVSISKKSGVPVAAVPLECLWGLVEYLSCRRTRVQYSYGPTHCYVRFLNIGASAAQRILDDWAKSVVARACDDDMLKSRGRRWTDARTTAMPVSAGSRN